MKKNKNPSKTAIGQVLRSCVFDPRASGPMRIIADVQDPMYYQQRAIEIIRLGEDHSRDPRVIDALKQAIGLLALAVVELEDAM